MHMMLITPFVLAGLAAKIINKRRSKNQDDLPELNVILNSLIISNAQMHGGLDEFFSEESQEVSAQI